MMMIKKKTFRTLCKFHCATKVRFIEVACHVFFSLSTKKTFRTATFLFYVSSLSLSCFARTFHTSVALLAKKRFLLLPPSSSDCSGLGLRRHEATRGRHLVPGWLSTTASASATAIQIGQLGALLRLRLLGPGGRLGRRRRRRRHTRLTRGRRKSGFATRRRGWIRGHPGRRRRRRPQLRRVRGHVRVAVHLGVEGSN